MKTTQTPAAIRKRKKKSVHTSEFELLMRKSNAKKWRMGKGRVRAGWYIISSLAPAMGKVERGGPKVGIEIRNLNDGCWGMGVYTQGPTGGVGKRPM